MMHNYINSITCLGDPVTYPSLSAVVVSESRLEELLVWVVVSRPGFKNTCLCKLFMFLQKISSAVFDI